MRINLSGMKRTAFAVAVIAVASLSNGVLYAQSGHDHGGAADNGASPQKRNGNELVATVRRATARFFDVELAKKEGYLPQFGCVSGSDFGAMGMHFVNGPLVVDGELDPTKPEIVIYEPQPDGKLKLVGADFLVLADQWNATHDGPPEMMGQLFHLFEAPNRFGLPAFYTLHVWAWKESPTGTFVNWHSNISCDAFNGDKH